MYHLSINKKAPKKKRMSFGRNVKSAPFGII
jgi:hypothetical protein